TRWLGSKLSRLSTGALLLLFLHALPEQHLELAADVLGFALEFVQKLALLVTNLAVGEEHPLQPGGLLGVDPAMCQDGLLNGLVEEMIEGGCEVLHPLVQLDEEVGLWALDVSVDVHLLA